MNDTNLVIGGKEFSSRLIVGTGKYASMDVMKEAHEASGAQIVTVALRRVALPTGGSILDYLDTTRYTLLPNTAGCYSADEAIRTCYLAREAGLGEMVKLEVIGDPRTLFPDVLGLLEATRTLARDGFTVMPYTNDDPVMAKKTFAARVSICALFSIATIVLSNVGGAGLLAIASTSASPCFIPSSIAGW